MDSLPFPQDANGQQYNSTGVFDQCIETVTDGLLRQRLAGIRGEVDQAAVNYAGEGAAGHLERVQRNGAVNGVPRDELLGLYDRLVRNAVPRTIYNRILNSPVNGFCPICGVGYAKTLDHYLPKSHYSLQVVNPQNLIPACRDCQHSKGSDCPEAQEDLTFHPYFDNFEVVTWLACEVREEQPAVFRFFVDGAHLNDPLLVRRIENHMEVFGLANSYALQAATESQSARGVLRLLLQQGGEAGVRAHLRSTAQSCAERKRNSWRSAMYRGAAESDWYCQGGFDAG